MTRSPPGARPAAAPREEQEDAVADLVAGRHAPLPDTVDLVVEQLAAGGEQGQLALDRVVARQLPWVDRLERGQEAARRVHLGKDRLATAVSELVVVLVQPEERRVPRMAGHERREAISDHGLELRVGRCLRRGRGDLANHWQRRRPGRAARGGDRPVDVVRVDAVVGDGADPLAAGVVDHLRAFPRERFKEGHAQLRPGQFEEHEIRPHAGRIEAGHAGHVGDAVGQPAGVGVVVRQPLDHPLWAIA